MGLLPGLVSGSSLFVLAIFFPSFCKVNTPSTFPSCQQWESPQETQDRARECGHIINHKATVVTKTRTLSVESRSQLITYVMLPFHNRSDHVYRIIINQELLLTNNCYTLPSRTNLYSITSPTIIVVVVKAPEKFNVTGNYDGA